MRIAISIKSALIDGQISYSMAPNHGPRAN
jgi:hypothetical protein